MRTSVNKIFSFPGMLASLLAVLAVFTVRSRFDDPDLWWNLKIGQVIWNTRSIPNTDLFSYTTNHHAWIAHEWLAQLVIYGAYKAAGYSGLMGLLCVLTCALLMAGYALCSLYAGNIKVGFAGALIVWLFATIGLAVRAQMIGYLLLIVELLLIHVGRTRNPRWFLALPVLFGIWVNCHASFILGLMVATVVWGIGFTDLHAGSLLSPSWNHQARRSMGIALGLSVVALFINPVGIKLILYPLDTMLNMPVLLRSVEEYAPLQTSSGRGLALMGILVLSFLLVMARRTEMYWDELLLLAMGTWLAVSHVRMLFVFGILAAPILSRQLATWWNETEVVADRPALNAAFMAGALTVAFLGFPSHQNLQAQVEEKSPVKAVRFMQAAHLAGPMLNSHAFGGYLMWAAPEQPVFLDGRTDVFEWTGVLQEFGDWATLQTAPSALLNKYRINFCLLNRDAQMVRVLPLLLDWKVVYSDNNSVILARNSAQSVGTESAQNRPPQ